jgi:hypothetical protein
VKDVTMEDNLVISNDSDQFMADVLILSESKCISFILCQRKIVNADMHAICQFV